VKVEMSDAGAGRPGAAEPAQQGVRLQKVLAAAGVGSRRACEGLISQGRVEVDGRPVTTQGLRVDPERSTIKVDGMRLATRTSTVYLALNKARGMLSTMSDPQGRPCVGDLVGDRRLFHVGRLDADSEGLLLLTNDGELAYRLTHPSFAVPRTYLAEVTGTVPRRLGALLRAGVELDDGVARVDSFRVVGRSGSKATIEVVLHEGRKHIVRRLLAAVAHPVQRLVRTRIGPLRLGELRPGRTRPLNNREIGELFAAVGL
jgi:23S rRNA pseudouridine2605 synthase